MAQDRPFCPRYGSGSTTAVVAVSTPVTIRTGSKNIRVANVGANEGWFRIGSGGPGVVATATDVRMPAGSIEVFTIDETHDTVALLSVAGGTSFHVILGEGW